MAALHEEECTDDCPRDCDAGHVGACTAACPMSCANRRVRLFSAGLRHHVARAQNQFINMFTAQSLKGMVPCCSDDRVARNDPLALLVRKGSARTHAVYAMDYQKQAELVLASLLVRKYGKHCLGDTAQRKEQRERGKRRLQGAPKRERKRRASAAPKRSRKEMTLVCESAHSAAPSVQARTFEPPVDLLPLSPACPDPCMDVLGGLEVATRAGPANPFLYGGDECPSSSLSDLDMFLL